MLGVFISYRRGPSTPYARQIYDELAERFGKDRVFYDIDTLEPGTDFLEVIERYIEQSGLMLVVLDAGWSTVSHPGGGLRLEDEDDPVRLEVSRGLASDRKVLPVLVGGAKMPKASELPKDLKPLVRRQAHELSDTRWRADIEDLVQRAAKAIGIEEVQPPRSQRGSPTKRRRRGLIAAGVGVVAVLAAVGAFVLGGSGDERESGGTGSTASLELATDAVGQARQVGTDTAELTDAVNADSDTSEMVSGFEQLEERANQLSDRVDTQLAAGDPGRDGLDAGSRGLARATSQLATVAEAPTSASAGSAAQSAKASMDDALAGIEEALIELRLAFADEGAADAEAAVDNSLEQLGQNRAQLTGLYDGLVEAVRP